MASHWSFGQFNPWAPNSTLYPFLELEAGSVPPSLNFPQLDFVKPSSGFHPVTWERVTNPQLNFDHIHKATILLLQEKIQTTSIWETRSWHKWK
jgi:hypothetical protein